MGENIFIYLSNGFYFGFINNGFLFSRDGICLGWLEGEYVWDLDGKFRGAILEIGGNKYILKNRFKLPPISRTSKGSIASIAPPPPPSNIKPIALTGDIIDAFTP